MTYDINGFFDFLCENRNFSMEEIGERLQFLKKLHETNTDSHGLFKDEIIFEIEEYCYGIDWCFFLETIDKGKKYRYGYDIAPSLYDELREHCFVGDDAIEKVTSQKSSYNKMVFLRLINIDITILQEHNYFDLNTKMYCCNCIVSIEKGRIIDCFTFKEFVDKLFNCKIRDEVQLLMEL